MRSILVGGSLLLAAACTTTGVVGYPAEYVETNGPSHVWVTESDNKVVELYNPQVHGDTLVGFDVGNYTEIPLSDVKLMRARFASPTRTALLAGGAAVGAALLVASLMGNSPGGACIAPGTDQIVPCPKPA